jgi:PKD repeat protein
MKSLRTFIVLFLAIIMVASAGCTDDDDKENTPPVAKAGKDQDVTMGDDGFAEVHFSAAGSSDDDGDDLSYSWDFDKSDGDNNVDSSDKTTSHKYHFTGVFTVTLRVSDGKVSHTDTVKVTVEKEPGNVEAVIDSEDELMDTVGEDEKKKITFDGSDSYSKEGTIEKYEWDYNYTGEDFDIDDTGDEVDHEFGTGIHRVALRVTNDSGVDRTTSVDVKMNYNQTYERNIDSDEEHSFMIPLTSNRAYYMKMVLSYDNSEYNALDLDLYLYYPNGTEANNTSDEDDDHEEIRYDRNGEYGEKLQSTGEWELKVTNGQYSRSSDYKLYIDIVYFS